VITHREQIEHPMFLDFSGGPVPPLKFVLQAAYAPAGSIERPMTGLTLTRTPWYTELGIEITGVDATAVLYQIPKGDGSELLVGCLDESFEPFFTLLSGPDYGEGVTQLTANHWPEIYDMLRRSSQRAEVGRLLCNVVTPGRVQWVVADNLPADRPDEIPNKQLLDLIGTSIQTYLRASNFGVELPGLVPLLGGPSLFDRRLQAITSLVGTATSLGGVLQGGLKATDLYDLGKSTQEAIERMKAIKG